MFRVACSPARLGRVVLLLAMLAGAAGPAAAVAPFARKFKISCATCHTAVPHLTTFGEAFRRQGFRFPGVAEDEIAKEEVVPLGTDGMKQVYPKAIWPTAIPEIPPVGFSIGHILRYQRDTPLTAPGPGQNSSFAGAGTIGEVHVAGTLDDAYTYLSQTSLSFDGVSNTRSYLSIYDVFGRQLGMNLKVGKFEPGLLEVSNFRRLTESGYLVLENRVDGAKTVGDSTWNPEPAQQGIEAFGFIGGDPDTAFNAGLVEGLATDGLQPNNAKDWYLHVNRKIIGEQTLGYHMNGTPATTAVVTTSRPGRNIFGDAHSVTVGGFVYGGEATLDAATRQRDPFSCFGGDARLIHDNWNLHGAFARQDHDRPDVGRAFGRRADVLSLEIDRAWFPWLITALRHETFDLDERAGDLRSRDFRRLVAAIQYVPRANINVTLGSDLVDRSAESGGFRVDNVTFALFVGF